LAKSEELARQKWTWKWIGRGGGGEGGRGGEEGGGAGTAVIKSNNPTWQVGKRNIYLISPVTFHEQIIVNTMESHESTGRFGPGMLAIFLQTPPRWVRKGLHVDMA